jgi:hypothetical protein
MRRSRRVLTSARFRDVVDIVALACRARHVLGAEFGDRFLAPPASAGALHAVRVIVVPLQGYPRAFAYDPIGDAVEFLRLKRHEGLQDFRDQVRACIPRARGFALGLLGDATMAGEAYRDPESLLWRDAGVLIQTISMVACAEGHAACALGVHGGGVAHALEVEDQFVALGAALIGRP